METSGALLGEIHGLLEREEVSSSDDRLARWFEDIERWIEELGRGGSLSDEYAGRVLERAADTRPARATWGLRHGDFCGENLVVSDRDLCCIDNVTVAPGILESDLAQTFCRWPMTTRERARFLLGYRQHALPTTFLDHEGFWMIAAALRSAAIRLRGNTGGIEAPLRVLKQHAP
jgi:aminoglycoside phosphotransferase (APT) family kinase protein